LIEASATSGVEEEDEDMQMVESTLEERKRGQVAKTKFINDFAYGVKYEKI